MPVPNLFLGLAGCHDTLGAEAKKKGQNPKLAVFVIPDTDPANGFYGTSRTSTTWFRGPYTTIQNTRDMVNQLWQISGAAQAPIDFLSISGHGNTPGFLGSPQSFFMIGSDKVTLQVLRNPADPVTMELARLQGVFAPNALVELRACFVGQDLPLIQAFSTALGGVRVQASRAVQLGPIPGLVGEDYQIYECRMSTCSPLAPYTLTFPNRR
jgi:hypothetical protein